jgi:hypothetical protein
MVKKSERLNLKPAAPSYSSRDLSSMRVKKVIHLMRQSFEKSKQNIKSAVYLPFLSQNFWRIIFEGLFVKTKPLPHLQKNIGQSFYPFQNVILAFLLNLGKCLKYSHIKYSAYHIYARRIYLLQMKSTAYRKN